MNNFTFYNPVNIIFGKDTIANASKEIPAGANVLVIYGGGSIKKNGVYDQVAAALKGYKWTEFAGIEANPHFETCMKAVELIRKEKIDYVLAVGGGSVIDATKFIVGATYFEGDAWDILGKGAPITKAVPFGCVLTLPATGSEMNNGGVITRATTSEKLAFSSPLVFPKFSILDPTTTYSLPARQTANGIVDAFVHVLEQYLTFSTSNAPVQDRFSEGILSTLIEEGPKVLADGNNYEARANIMWAATMALNGILSVGVPQDWATHMIGHELTAFYGIDHAQSLAVVLPSLLEVTKDYKGDKLVQLGERVFNIKEGSKDAKVSKTIEAIENFFHSVTVPTKLSDYKLGKEAIEPVAQRFVDRGWKLGEKGVITADTVREILTLAL